MKVAFVANTCWNIYNFRKGLVHHFLSNGDEVIVLAPKDEYSASISEWGVRWIDTPLQGTGTNPIKDLGYLKKIVKAFKKERPDVALSYTIKANIYSSLAGKLSGVPVICNVSGLGTVFLVKGTTGKLAMLLYKIAFRFSSYIFFQNEDDKDLFTSVIKVDKDTVGLLPGSGINLKEFRLAPYEPDENVKILMISRVIIEKGVREYAEAAAHFNGDGRLQFTLIGKFDQSHARSIEQKELDEWIGDGRMTYHPHSDEIAKVITEHDVVVLPSYREGTPRTLLEAAALGRPLLTADVPGCKEVVKDGYNGFLFEVKSAESLIDKIKLFLSLSTGERKQLAGNSRILVEKIFDEKIVIDTYTDTIRRITQ